MIKEAAAFAAEAHKGAVRKGSNIPYMTHPAETAVIVAMMTEDECDRRCRNYRRGD